MKLFSTLGLVFLGCASLASAASSAPADSNLRTLANYRGIRFGAAVTFPGSNRALYDSTLSQQYNTVVCENAMKFGNIEPTNGNFNFTNADAIVDWAVAHNMSIRGHNLLWYQQSGYLANLKTASVSRDSFFVLMRRHVNTVMGRYKGKIYEWDVVNEAIDENQADGNRKGANSFYEISGNKNDYIDSMFVWAHKADSSAHLIYNDYNVEGGSMGGSNTKKVNFMYEMVKGMKQRGVPIMGVGFQSHLTSFDTAAIAANMRRYDSLGLTVSITELDISINSATDSAVLKTQKGWYKAVMAMCLRAPNCKTFMTWGVNDESSWHSNQYPLIFKGAATMTKKPAYYGLQEAFLEAGGGPVAIARPAQGRAAQAIPALLRRPESGVVGARDPRGNLFDMRGRNMFSPAPALK